MKEEVTMHNDLISQQIIYNIFSNKIINSDNFQKIKINDFEYILLADANEIRFAVSIKIKNNIIEIGFVYLDRFSKEIGEFFKIPNSQSIKKISISAEDNPLNPSLKAQYEIILFWKSILEISRKQKYNFIKSKQDALVEKIRKKDQIRVGLLVTDNTKWNLSSLWNEFKKHPRISPKIILASRKETDWSAEERRISFKKELNFFSEIDSDLISIYDSSQDSFSNIPAKDFDLLFIQQPWGFLDQIKEIYDLCLMAYTPYAYIIYDDKELDYNLQGFNNFIWLYLAQSNAQAELHKEVNPYINQIVSGYLKFEQPYTNLHKKSHFKTNKDKNPKKIIYAPHHSLPKELLKISTFHMNWKLIFETAAKTPNTSWVYKPHPRLGAVVERNGVMSKEDYIKYENGWHNLPNGTVYNQGNYLDIFHESDVMITDCSSFLAEYLITGNPLIWLKSPNTTLKFNKIGEEISRLIYHVNSEEEFLATYEKIIVQGEDPLFEKRQEFIKNIISCDFPSQRVIAFIETSLLKN